VLDTVYHPKAPRMLVEDSPLKLHTHTHACNIPMHTHMQTCATYTCTYTNTHTHVLQHVCAILHVKSGDEIVSCITDMMKTIESRQHLDKVLLVHILDPSVHDHSYRD